MTPQEWRDKTVKDISQKRKEQLEGQRQAKNYSFENMHKVKRRCRYKNN